jgi:hypothetical protein
MRQFSIYSDPLAGAIAGPGVAADCGAGSDG